MFILVAIIAYAATAHAAPLYHTDGSKSNIPLTNCEDSFSSLDVPEDGTFAPNAHNQLLSFTNDGEVHDFVTLDPVCADEIYNDWIEMENSFPGFPPSIDGQIKMPEGPMMEKRQIKIPPVFRPFTEGGNVEDDGSSVSPPDGRPKKPDNDVLQKRQIKIPPVFTPFVDELPTAENDISAVPPREKRPNTTTINSHHVSHRFPGPTVSLPSFSPDNKSINLTAINNALANLEPQPPASMPPGLKGLPELDTPKGGKLIPRGDEGNADLKKDECRPYKYCVDSSGCGGGCDACTYVGWFPYGQCMARQGNVGRIVD